MNIRKTISLEEARQIDIVDYLSILGHKPAKIRNVDYWYLSPLRDEKTPSFKINRKLNKWYDHGMGKGGNLIDFGLLYHDCTIGELLSKLTNGSSFQKPLSRNLEQIEASAESKLTVVRERPIYSFSLQRYLHQRCIPLEVAEAYCREITYKVNGKVYYAIGFKNDAGGYELRNRYFKGSTAPKDITTLQESNENATVFEGFFDLLSFLSIHKNQVPKDTSFIVLNSLSLFEKARLFMEGHRVINLYLDQDKAGRNYSRYALSLSTKYQDKSELYKHYKDLNDWTMHFGKAPKHTLKL